VQLYSALVFHGLRLVAAIKSELSVEVKRGGHRSLQEIVGADAAAMIAEPWPAI
jgi:dihydroorotate dehydrogenase